MKEQPPREEGPMYEGEMKLPVKRISVVSKIAHEVEMTDDVDLRSFALSCLNQLSEVRRRVAQNDAKGAEEALSRAERMADRIRSWNNE